MKQLSSGPLPSTHITDSPAELLIGVCLTAQAPSTDARAVLEARGQGDVPLPHGHLSLSYRLGEWGLCDGFRCFKGYGRVKMRSAWQSCNKGWYLPGKGLLRQEMEGEHPSWQGQRKWEPWPGHLSRAPFLTSPLSSSWCELKDVCSLPLGARQDTFSQKHNQSHQLHAFVCKTISPFLIYLQLVLSHGPHIFNMVIFFKYNNNKTAHTHTKSTYKEISLAFLKRCWWLWILQEAWVS